MIEAALYATEGGAAMRNIAGSFYDFEASSFDQTSSERLVSPPDEWGARAAVAWVAIATKSLSFSPDAEDYVAVAKTLDRIYAAGATSNSPDLGRLSRSAV